MKSIPSSEIATFAAGCFWGIEAAFSRVPGVLNVESGYTGGHVDNPSYEQVCTGKTGHAESVRVEFDPALVTYEDMLRVFWKIHDPTTLNRQGPDVGEQYRSAIFFHSPEQEKSARASKEALVTSGIKAVTEIVPAGKWWRAEEYHQKYFDKNPNAVCHI